MIRNCQLSEHLHQTIKMLDYTQGWFHAAAEEVHENIVRMKAPRKRTNCGVWLWWVCHCELYDGLEYTSRDRYSGKSDLMETGENPLKKHRRTKESPDLDWTCLKIPISTTCLTILMDLNFYIVQVLFLSSPLHSQEETTAEFQALRNNWE